MSVVRTGWPVPTVGSPTRRRATTGATVDRGRRTDVTPAAPAAAATGSGTESSRRAPTAS